MDFPVFHLDFLGNRLLIAVIAVLLIAVSDAPGPHVAAADSVRVVPEIRHWRGLLAGVFLGALGTPADAFLVLLLARAGIAPALVALLWSAHNVVRFASTFGAGLLADRLSRVGLVAGGWTVRALFLGGFAFAGSLPALVAVFLVYGLAVGLSEPAERALIADLVRRGAHGRAFGLYHAAIGLGALPAGLLFGEVWDRFGAPLALGVSSGLVLLGSATVLGCARRGPGAQVR